MRSKKRNIAIDEDIAILLAERTNISLEVIHTILHYYERILLHKVMIGDHVIMGKLFRIYHLNDMVHIELTEAAIKYIRKGKVK